LGGRTVASRVPLLWVWTLRLLFFLVGGLGFLFGAQVVFWPLCLWGGPKGGWSGGCLGGVAALFWFRSASGSWRRVHVFFRGGGGVAQRWFCGGGGWLLGLVGGVWFSVHPFRAVPPPILCSRPRNQLDSTLHHLANVRPFTYFNFFPPILDLFAMKPQSL